MFLHNDARCEKDVLASKTSRKDLRFFNVWRSVTLVEDVHLRIRKSFELYPDIARGREIAE
jgi:hypothetical protein